MATDKRPSRDQQGPSAAAPPLSAVMADRLRTAVSKLDGVFLYRNEALDALAFTLTGLPFGPERDAAFEQALQALAHVARPAPEVVIGALRGAA